VAIDTTTIDVWVPSSKCEECEYFNVYTDDTIDSSGSSAFKAFAPTVEFSNDVEVTGEEVVDEVYLGPLAVEGQKFGAITSFPEEFYPICGNVDGVIGLGKPEGNGDSLLEHLLKDLPAPVVSFYFNANADDYMMEDENRRLPRNGDIDGAVVDALDDGDDEYGDEGDGGEYETEDTDEYYDGEPSGGEEYEDDADGEYMDVTDEVGVGGEDEEFEYEDIQDYTGETEGDVLDLDYEEIVDEEYVDDYGAAVDDVYDMGDGVEITSRPVFARSELILGGVNPEHYEGCLSWHPTAPTKNNAWSIEVYFGDPEYSRATIATTSHLIHGPAAVVGDYLTANNAQCFQLVQIEAEDEYAEPQEDLGPEVECKDGTSDIAFYDCAGGASYVDKFIPFEFEAQGTKYALGFDELIDMYFDEEAGVDVCEFRMASLNYDDGEEKQWIFGTPLFQKYYIALDVQQGTVGIAPARQTTITNKKEDFCDDDKALFITDTFETSLTSPTNTATTQLISTNKNNQISSKQQNSNDDHDASSYINMTFIIPVMIVLVFVIGLIIKRKRSRSSSARDDAATRTTPGAGVNYDFVDPSCRDFQKPMTSAVDDYGGEDDENWSGYDERQFT